jgi:hypothetical protein
MPAPYRPQTPRVQPAVLHEPQPTLPQEPEPHDPEPHDPEPQLPVEQPEDWTKPEPADIASEFIIGPASGIGTGIGADIFSLIET